MKIHYNKDFECYMVTECHITDKIELDGVKLIPITELEKLIGTMLQSMQIISGEFGNQLTNEQESYNDGLRKGIELLRAKLSKLKGE